MPENVGVGQAEVPRSIEHATVIGVHLAKSMLSGASEMERIPGAQDRLFRQPADTLADRSNQIRGDREPMPHAGFFVLFEVGQNVTRLPRRDVRLSQVSLNDADEFEAGELARCETGCFLSQSSNLLCARFVQIALGDVRCVEVHHARSRISA